MTTAPTPEMAELVLGLADQLRWGVDVTPPTVPDAELVVVAGMGGSGMAARVAALLADSGPAIVHVHQGYALPGWAVPNRASVVAVSYSGNTVETLSGVEEALAAGLPVAAVTSGGRLADLAARHGLPVVAVPGGRQPRAALGHQVAATVSLLHAAGAIGDPRPQLAAAADLVDRLLDGGAGTGWALGADLGAALLDRVPVVVGGTGPAAVAAARWATQFHENAKRAGFAVTVPEMNHNLLEALASSAPEPGRLGVVGLLDPAGPPANDRRIRLTLDRLGPNAARSGEVSAQGEGPLERVASLVAVGDVASVVLADRLGVDPVAVDALEAFKKAL